MEIKENDIYLGDSYELIKQIPDKSIDCIYTDVPYDYGYVATEVNENASAVSQRVARMRNTLVADGIANGFNYDILNEFVRVMKKINCFIWCSKQQIMPIMKFFVEEHGCNFNILTWNKTNPAPQTNNTWLTDIEYCLYFREEGVKLNDGYELKSMWYVDKCNKTDKDLFNHPTIKPLQLVQRHLLHATQPGDIILDPFAGSGTTCIAAKLNDRKYIGIELLEKWYRIAKDRLDGIMANGQTSFLIR